MRFWIIYILVQSSFFKDMSWLFSQIFFYNFLSSVNHGGRNFYSAAPSPLPPTMNKLPAALERLYDKPNMDSKFSKQGNQSEEGATH